MSACCRTTVHLTAPGEAIVSTLVNGWYGPMDGTSMSTPMVAAAAALLQSAASKCVWQWGGSNKLHC